MLRTTLVKKSAILATPLTLTLLLFLLILCVSGCTLIFSIPANESMHLSVYQAGKPVYERELNSTDPVAQTINLWLAANPDGWSYAVITRSPDIYLKGKNFSVNILKNEVTVKYCRAFYNCHLWVKTNDDLFGKVEKIMQLR